MRRRYCDNEKAGIPMGSISTFVVNLEEDADRLNGVTRQLDPAYFRFRERIGFLGRMLPDGVCLRLTRDPNSLNNKGALGVMMSHVLIWERVALLDAPFALVLEDDVTLNRAERLASFQPPQPFDIIFCGDQTAQEPVASADTVLSCAPAVQAIPLIEARNVSVGAYGYLLSPAGARRLLAFFAEHLYFGHVDVRMMAYCCDLGSLNRLGPLGRVTEELRAIRQLLDDQPLIAGYAMIQPLITHVGMTSRREREDELGIARNRAL